MPLALSAGSRLTTLPNGALSRGVSPAANRLSGHYNIPYDPRDWSGSIQQIDLQRRLDRSEAVLAEPPPPYLPPARGVITTTAIEIPAQSQQLCPTAVPDISRNAIPARQVTFGVTSTQHAGHGIQQEVVNLPPPPRRAPQHRAMTIDVEASHGPPSYTRRSTSAGPSLVTTQTRAIRVDNRDSLRSQQEGRSSMLLPGPPSGPPPSSSRSQSTGGQVTARPRPARLQIRDSNLATIPATPADADVTTFPRIGPTLPLRVDTTSTYPISDPPVLIDTIAGSTTSASGLARRSAIRGSSLNRALRDEIRAAEIQSTQEPPSSAVSNNPWASAIEQTVLSPDNRVATAMPPPRTEGAKTSSSTVTRQLGTPPITPGVSLQKARADPPRTSQQAKALSTPPSSQKPLNSANSVSAQPVIGGQDDNEVFIRDATRRHAEFIRRETVATDDAERLQVFLKYMLDESTIRRERYIAAFQSSTFDVEKARKLLFSSPQIRQASTRGDDTPSVNLVQSPAQTSNCSSAQGDTFPAKNYQPALSTIASAEPDDMSSRGRAPSRWWESQTASNYQDERGQAIKRSKRESKYMSLSKQLLQNMESQTEPLPEAGVFHDTQYPIEKQDPGSFGIYEDETGMPTPSSLSQPRRVSGKTPLDISRFVTLPPPYPRHYPAVSNCHPDLAEYRNTVRTISDISDAKGRYERHDASILALRAEREKEVAAAQKTFKAEVRDQIEDGVMTYQDAAKKEERFRQETLDAEKQALQADFETLKDVVINPLHEEFNQRINALNHSIHSLQNEMFASAVNQNPDRPVQEGDDVPELLEQLTQLKWLFEAREHLHQELFELLSRRNHVYGAVVILPYKQAGHLDKARDTEAWFEADAAARQAAFRVESVRRHEAFFNSVEDNASRGIALQSSAFWDITPDLVDLVQKIPNDLSQLDVLIPDDELSENPSYRQYPQQYLYLLLRHAQQSVYQYIEGQINLHCLAHEVKTAMLTAQYKAADARRRVAGERTSYTDAAHKRDESELNNELKDRARTIEEQWQDSLGRHLTDTQERVREYLEVNGGWEDFDISEV